MTCLCSCERGGDALTGRGWYPGKPFLFVVLLDTCIFDTFALAAALLSISGFSDRRSRLLSPGYTADGWTAFWIYCDRTLLLLTLGVVTYLIFVVICLLALASLRTSPDDSMLKQHPSALS